MTRALAALAKFRAATRRWILIWAFLSLAARARRERVPSEEGPLNAFATEYNRYVASLRAGVVDVRQWRRVVQAWERLTG